MNKRERVEAAIAGKEPDFIPSGFSLHFPKEKNAGEAGIQAHLDFFKETDTDIFKIMNENLVPNQGEIKVPEDWKCIGSMNRETPIIKTQLEFSQEILDRCPEEGYFLGTLHGITASSIHPIEMVYGYDGSRTMLVEHLRANPTVVQDAMKRIAEGMCYLAKGYAEIGVHGIYYASLGGEPKWFTDEEFDAWIAPLDKLILSEIRKAGCDVFLHICKDGLSMERYASYNDYCDVVNWGVYEVPYSLEDGKKLFPGKTIMGGLANRSGVMVEGNTEQLKQAALDVAAAFGKKGFILGADCTLPTEIDYSRIRTLAHAMRENASPQRSGDQAVHCHI